MPRWFLFAPIALVLATPAAGQQLFLNHGDCAAAAPAKNRNLDCASTLRTYTLVASLATAQDPGEVFSDDGIIDLQVGANPSVMPAFWQFNLAGCTGPPGLGLSPDFTAGPFSCYDPWQGVASGSWRYGGQDGSHDTDGNRARLRWSWLMPPGATASFPAATECYVARIMIRTASAARCAGCSTPVCVTYAREALNRTGGEQIVIDRNPDRLSINDPANTMGCPPACVSCPWDPVANKPSTWGSLKSLYR